MAGSFEQLVKSSKSTLILLPTNPSFDQVAAGLSLYLAIKDDKNDVFVACPTPMVVEFNRLVGVNKVSSELGNKNLTIRFVDYKAENVERVSYDIENGEFRLTVIPKPQMISPTKEQVSISYAGISSELVILIGGTNENHFPALSSKDTVGAKLAHVGVKSLTLSQPKEILSFARSGSSVSEVVMALIKESQFEMDGDIATNLLMGLEEGTEGFSTLETTADTFTIAAELMRAGGKRFKKAEMDPKGFPPGAIPGQMFRQPPPPKSWYEPKVYKGSGGTPAS